MTISDELRALIRRIENFALCVPLDLYDECTSIAADTHSVADRLEGKVVVRPTMRRYDSGAPREPFIAELWDRHTAIGTTEAEAIANLQTALDGGE